MREIEITESGLGINIGISLAIERLLGINEELPKSNYILNKDVISISLATMVRTTLQAMETDMRNKLVMSKDTTLMKVIINKQIDTLLNLSSIIDTKELRIVLHRTKYPKFSKEFTGSDKLKDNLLLFTVMLEKEYPNIPYGISRDSTLVITSNPFDILNIIDSKSRDTKILNTNTGDVLPKSMFYKKMNKGKTFDTTGYPFNRTLLKIFGDTYGFIKGEDISTKRRIHKVLDDAKISYRTEEYKIRKIISKGLKDDK